MSWGALQQGDDELAAFGAARFASGVAYLATAGADGAPRVHPITPIVGDGHLFVAMNEWSPKRADLDRDPRYALHCSVENQEGGDGEFWVSGHATVVDDTELRAKAVDQAPYQILDRHVVFVLDVARADSLVYGDDGETRRSWRPD